MWRAVVLGRMATTEDKQREHDRFAMSVTHRSRQMHGHYCAHYLQAVDFYERILGAVDPALVAASNERKVCEELVPFVLYMDQ